jgi:hypothetical protein
MSIIRRFGCCLVFLTLHGGVVFARKDSAITSQHPVTQVHSIQVAKELRAEFGDLLQRSPTFRAQYQRIAAAGDQAVIVGVHVDVRLCETSFRARTTFRRYRTGLMVADVAIGPGGQPGEWIAHEFEHILEQLDGRNLPQLANSHANDVWFSGSDVIETDRAIRAGRTVRDELRQAPNSR